MFNESIRTDNETHPKGIFILLQLNGNKLHKIVLSLA